MRTAFHQQLDALCTEIADICGLAGVAMERATQALLQADLAIAWSRRAHLHAGFVEPSTASRRIGERVDAAPRPGTLNVRDLVAPYVPSRC